MKKVFVSIILFSIIISSIVYAHPGRTDSNGGHYDRSTGVYHYHNGGSYYEDGQENNENKWITANELLEEARSTSNYQAPTAMASEELIKSIDLDIKKVKRERVIFIISSVLLIVIAYIIGFYNGEHKK